MPRVARTDIPGALYYVIVRGIERRDIFMDDEDRYAFVERLITARENGYLLPRVGADSESLSPAAPPAPLRATDYPSVSPINGVV